MLALQPEKNPSYSLIKAIKEYTFGGLQELSRPLVWFSVVVLFRISFLPCYLFYYPPITILLLTCCTCI